MSLSNFYEAPKHELSETDHVLKDSKGIVIVDFSQIAISTITAMYKPNDELSVDMLRHVILNTLRANVFKYKNKYPDVIIAVDNAKGGYWRKQEAWYYKYSRKEGREKSDFDWKTVFDAMDTVKNELRDIFPLRIIDERGLEADDIIAVIAKAYSPVVPVLIVSSDGDFTQCHNKNVKQWSPMQKKWVKSKNGGPQRDLWMKVLRGDKKDGIAGFLAKSDHYTLPADPDTGRKPRAPSVTKKIIAELIDSDVNNLDEVRSKVTNEQFERIKENLLLLDLNNLPQWVTDAVLKQVNEYDVPNGRKLYSYTIKHRLTKLRDNIQDFLPNQ